MTTENNRLTMQRFTGFINTASEKLAGELISPNVIFHVPGCSESMRGPAGYLAIIGMMRGGFLLSTMWLASSPLRRLRELPHAVDEMTA
jgi:hypothetical protein